MLDSVTKKTTIDIAIYCFNISINFKDANMKNILTFRCKYTENYTWSKSGTEGMDRNIAILLNVRVLWLRLLNILISVCCLYWFFSCCVYHLNLLSKSLKDTFHNTHCLIVRSSIIRPLSIDVFTTKSIIHRH